MLLIGSIIDQLKSKY